MSKYKNIRNSMLFAIIATVESVFLILMIQFLMSYSVTNAISWAWLHKKIFILSILILNIMLLGLVSICKRFWIANSIFLILFTVFGFANGQKMKLRGESVLPSDLKQLNNIVSLIHMINIVSVIGAVIICVVIAGAGYIISKNWTKRFSINSSLWMRIVGIMLTAIMVLGFFRVNHQKSLSGKIFEKFGVATYFQGPDTTGPILTFINGIDLQIMKKPAGYSQAKMVKIERKYGLVSREMNAKRSNQDINKQTLIYVLSESFSDLKRVPNLNISGDPIKNVRKIKSKTTSGLMLSSGYGGGTANMEYMADTSLAMNFLNQPCQHPLLN